MGALLSRYEWLIIGALVIGLLVAELISVRRSIRRARKDQPPTR